MERNNLLKNLEKNLKEIDKKEKEIEMLTIAEYQKNIEHQRKEKVNLIKEDIKKQSKLYDQDINKYKEKINEIIKCVKNSQNRLTNIYDGFYLKANKEKINAFNKQKEALANLIILNEKREELELSKGNDLIDEVEYNYRLSKINNLIIANAQKKLNFSEIFDLCQERMEWCNRSFEIDMNEIFKSSNNKLEEYKENIFIKIKRKIFNLFSGNKKFTEFMDNYKNAEIKNIEKNCNNKIVAMAMEYDMFDRQIRIANKNIKNQYQSQI